MGISYYHTRMGVLDENNQLNILYPQNTGKDVSLSIGANSNIPSTATTVQALANQLAASAFSSQISDGSTSSAKIWSSSKINNEITALSNSISNPIDDTSSGSSTTAYSASKIKSEIAALINDSASTSTNALSASYIINALSGLAATSHTHDLATSNSPGFLRALSNDTTQFLCGDGTWRTPPLASANNDGYMSAAMYTKLEELYSKEEIDELLGITATE